jgi:hypothetical protein
LQPLRERIVPEHTGGRAVERRVGTWDWIRIAGHVSPATSMRRCATTLHKGSRPALGQDVAKKKFAGNTATNAMTVIAMTMTTEGEIGDGSLFPDGVRFRVVR